MPAIYKPGKKVRTYEIVRELNRGAFANSYEARDLRGDKVFFKQYKSPTKLVEWYPGFVAHQQELKARIEKDPAARDRCYRFKDFFEDESSGFHQVFEFVEGGKDLSKVLQERDSFPEEQMAMFAKVMMFGMRALHAIKIVHTDLKPDNIILIPDPVTRGHRLRIIDLDWAIFSDKRAPWHGKQGYTGTPGYQSPEHLRGEIPSAASDIFTCGLMLSQVLGDGHPFADSGESYDKDVQRGKFRSVRLKYSLPGVSTPEFLEAILNSCLDPDARKRPTAAQICDALMGKEFTWSTFAKKSDKPREPEERGPKPPPTPPPVESKPRSAASKLAVTFEGRTLTTVSVDAELGKRNFKSEHADAQFLSDPQFRLRKNDGMWLVEHSPGATNETIVDGRKLISSEPVTDGMRVSVGNSSKGIEKFSLILKLLP